MHFGGLLLIALGVLIFYLGVTGRYATFFATLTGH